MIAGSLLPIPEGFESQLGWQSSLRRHRAVLALALIGAAVVGAYYVGVKGESRSAFNRWQPMVRQLLDGEDVYQRYAFPTPPIMGLILYPFTALPGKWAMASWFTFKAALTALALFWAFRMLDRLSDSSEPRANHTSTSPPTWVFLIILCLAARPIIGDLLHGNVNLWILFLLVASFVAFRSRHDLTSGCLLALAIASKLTPALLLVYFLWKRAWRVAAGCAVGLLLWLIVVPGVVLGQRHNVELLSSWTRQMVAPFVIKGEVETEQINQSIPGLMYRLLTPSMAIKPDDGRPPISINVLSLDPATARTVLRAVVAMVLISLASLCRSSIDERESPAILHEFGLVMIAMLLLSERSWKHHYVILLPTYAALVHAAWQAGQARSTRTLGVYLWTALALSAALMALTSKDILKPFFGGDGSKYAQSYGAYVWAALVLAAAHVACLKCKTYNSLVPFASRSDAHATPPLAGLAQTRQGGALG